MAYASTADLLADLRSLRLLEPEQLEKAARLQERVSEPGAFAQELVNRRWLTAYQANLLLQGRGTELVLGAYNLLARIGEGGMGEVFKARHRRLDRIVALKIIREKRLSNPAAVQRFEREMKAVCQVSHPNVVHAIDADDVDGKLFIAMELVDGIDLGKLVAGSGPLGVAEACEYARQAALGLEACHARGLIHRDIKPSNLLLTYEPASSSASEGRRPAIKIFDLGLARIDAPGSEQAVLRLTMDGKILGTPDYLAPEQARNSHHVDGRADLYSLGCTLFFLLTGKPPFYGGTKLEKLVSHQMDEAPRLERVRPEVPRALAKLVAKLLAKRPEDRYQSATEVAAVLGPFTKDAGEIATSASLEATPLPLPAPLISPKSTPSRANRKLLLLTLSACAALAVVGLLIGLFFLLRSNSLDAPDTSGEPRGAAPADRRLALEKLNPGAIPVEKRPVSPLPELIAVLGEARRRHWGIVQSVAFSRDQRLIASGGQDNAVRIWDAENGRERAAFPVGGLGVAAVAFRKDGALLAISLSDNKPPDVRAWTPATGMVESIQLDGTSQGAAAALSPDARTMAASFGTRDGVSNLYGVRLWDLTTGKMRSILEDRTLVQALAWSGDGQTLAVASGKIIKLWSNVAGQERTVLPGPDKPVTHLCISTSGESLAWAASQENRGAGEITVWDTAGNKERASFSVARPVTSLAFGSDSRFLAVGMGNAETGRIGLYNPDTGAEQLTLQGHGGPVTCLSFLADGKKLASGSSDHTVRLWDTTTGQEIDPLRRQHGASTAVTFAAEGRGVAALTGPWEPRVRFWEFALGKELDLPTGHRGGISGIGFSENGATLATWGPWGASFWDTASGQSIARMQPPRDAQAVGALAPDGRTLATVDGRAPIIKLWDAVAFGQKSAPRAVLRGHSGALTALSFSPDGKLLASAASDNSLKVWRFSSSSNEQVSIRYPLSGLQAPAAALAFSPDGRWLASASRDGNVRLWDMRNGHEQHTLSHPTNLIASLQFSHDSKSLAVWSGHGVKLWDVATGSAQASPRLSAPLRALTFSPDSKRVATAEDDGTVAVWRAASGEQLQTMRLAGPVHQLAFAPGGGHLATANGNGTVYVLRLAKAEALARLP